MKLALFSRRPRVGSLTVATQTGATRMHMLEELCRCWNIPRVQVEQGSSGLLLS